MALNAQLANVMAEINGWQNGYHGGYAMDNSFHVDKTTVVIYGSSLIRDAHYFSVHNPLQRHGVNEQLNIPGVFVQWIGVPGLKLARIGFELNNGVGTPNGLLSFQTALTFNPDVAICLWGGNDTDNGENPEDMSWLSVVLAEMFHCITYICSVVPRPSPYYMSGYLFQQRAHELTKETKERLQGNLFPLLRFKQLKRFENAVTPLHWDGIHLNDQGNMRLYHNLRKAVIEGIKFNRQ